MEPLFGIVVPILTPVIIVSGFIMLARSALFWLYWTQARHYRLDRIWLEIKRGQFWRLIFSKHRIIILALFALWLVIVGALFVFRALSVFSGIALQSLIVIYLSLYALASAYTVARQRLQVPSPTAKITALFLAIILFEIISLYRSADPTILILVIEMFQPLIVLVLFALAYIPNIFLHRYFINHAKKKITAHKNLIVIGITGSYGKTSTKEFLAHILSKKYKVLKTPAHINVDTGVAKVILRDLKPEHEIFIVEMGAYKRGEIKKICDLVKPQYALLAGLSNQHLALFGSPEAIVEAKFELVEAVSRVSGHIVANADSAPLVAEFKRRRVMPVWYGLKSHATRFKPTDIAYSEGETSFVVHGIKFQSPAVGTAALNNLLGATTAAVGLGLHLDEIAPLISDLPKIPGTMELKHGSNGTLFIDDTYNANTEGVLAALADLEYFKRTKKILVFSEVIELGARTDEDHARIARAAAKSATHAFLLPSRMMHAMRSQLIECGYEAAQIISSTDELKKLLDSDTVVLFEGRDAAKILAKL